MKTKNGHILTFSEKMQISAILCLATCDWFCPMTSQISSFHAQALHCGDPISISETEDALNSRQNGKSPGNDGLPKEFYLHFFDIIGQE